WTSMTTGRDFKVRFDHDYIYTEWVSLPWQLQSTPAFVRSELKKTGDIWVGKTRVNMPCEVQSWAGQNVRWYTIETEMQILKVSDSRIEGRSLAYPAGIDCKKGKPKGNPEWQ